MTDGCYTRKNKKVPLKAYQPKTGSLTKTNYHSGTEGTALPKTSPVH
jgi:hypothetical protein